MTGKLILNESQINTYVPIQAGTYILANGNNQAIYVGRSDTDLNGRLKEHLPGSEKNIWIRLGSPAFFYFEAASNTYEAYKNECIWFHKYKPNCNTAHPSKLSSNWFCPVCGS